MGWKIVAQGNGNRLVKKLLQLQPLQLLLHLSCSYEWPVLSPDQYKIPWKCNQRVYPFQAKVIMTPAGKLIAGFLLPHIGHKLQSTGENQFNSKNKKQADGRVKYQVDKKLHEGAKLQPLQECKPAMM
jgi:hypothetical protein